MSKHTPTPSSLRGARIATRAVSILLLLPLGACGLNKVYAPPEVSSDYRERHPVVLAESKSTIDVFPHTRGPKLDDESRLRIHDFVSRYKRFGEGMITVLAPIGGPDPRSLQHEVELVRRGLAQEGVGHLVYFGTYPVKDPALAAPVRLTYTGLKAEVAGRCGEWPDDLASGASLEGWQNHTFWNFGCANQATLSAQIADPRDLVTPRGETPQDIETRMRAIQKVRQGADPSTGWATKTGNISGVGG
jgi:pilus assembly protein CpaD